MILDIQPILKNDLVILRPLENTDFASLYQVACDPLIWAQHPCSNRYREHVFRELFNDSLESKGALVIIDKTTSQIIGSTRFKRIKGTETAIEIGWSFLSRSYWGGRYNKSIKGLMCNYAFKTVDDVVFYIDKNNIRSQKAVEKIGGSKIGGPTFAHLLSDNQNNLTYAIHKKDWKP